MTGVTEESMLPLTARVDEYSPDVGSTTSTTSRSPITTTEGSCALAAGSNSSIAEIPAPSAVTRISSSRSTPIAWPRLAESTVAKSALSCAWKRARAGEPGGTESKLTFMRIETLRERCGSIE
eukprot:2042235-Prymnesium_polylepis.1